jgi:hypothetical protein
MKALHSFEMSASAYTTSQCLIPQYMNHHFIMFSVATKASFANVNECATKFQN